MTQTRIDFPVLGRGAHGLLPPGIMAPESAEGPLWRELVNLRPVDGELRRREALSELTGGPTYLDDEAQDLVLCAEITSDLFRRVLLVTTREVWVGEPPPFSTWWNMTPRYETGTVSITNGTANLTGSGTLWLDRRIAATQQVELPRGSGDWYKIQSVGSNTAITLATNYTGTTLAAANYSIRRTFGMATHEQVWCSAVTINSDVYLSGILAWGEILGSTVPEGCVLKISGAGNVLNTSFDPVTDTSYMLGGSVETEAGVDVFGYYIEYVYGLAALADGRLVVPIHWLDDSTDEGGRNRIIYSSHLNPAVWLTTPGGFTDLIDLQGSITGMESGSRYVAVHFTDGIEVGQLTGQDDPPLEFRPSRASQGALGPRLITSVPDSRFGGGSVFLGQDLNLYQFNGSGISRLDVPVRQHLLDDDYFSYSDLDAGRDELRNAGWMRPNQYRSEIGIHRGPYEVRWNYETGGVSFHEYPLTLTAGREIDYEAGGGLVGPANTVVGYAGGARKDGTGTDRVLVYEIRDDLDVDVTPGYSLASLVYKAISDALSFGALGRTVTIAEIQVWARDASGTLTVLLRRGGVGDTKTATAITSESFGEGYYRIYPDHKSSQIWELELRPPAGVRLTRMVVYVADVGDGRAA